MTERITGRLRPMAAGGSRRLLRFAGAFLLASTLAATGALAVPIDSIEVGEPYYINNFLAENDLVYVRYVDLSTGRVKVQHVNGAVDWVNASDLLTQSEARNADTGEAIGTMAVVGGALWAILDPEGFEKAMSSNSADSVGSDYSDYSTPVATTPAQSPADPSAVAISGVPFAPVLPGAWIDEGQVWVDWAEGRLVDDLKVSADIESVRIKHVPFYSTGQRDVVLAECVQTGRVGAYYILAVTESSERTVLNGNGDSIHQFNRMLGLSVDSAEEAEAYLKFFASAIAADNGIFLVLERDMEGIDDAALAEIGVSPIRVYPDGDGNWRIDADVLYGSDVFSAVFQVTRDGMVEMIEDNHKRRLAFDYVVAMEGGRRMYVRNQ